MPLLAFLAGGCGGAGSGGTTGSPITGSFVIDDAEAHDFSDSLYGVCTFQFRGDSWAGTFDLDLDLAVATCAPEATLQVTGGLIVLWSDDPDDTWRLVLTAEAGTLEVTNGDCGRPLAGDLVVEGSVVEQAQSPSPPFNRLAGVSGRMTFTFGGTSDDSGTFLSGTISGELR